MTHISHPRCSACVHSPCTNKWELQNRLVAGSFLSSPGPLRYIASVLIFGRHELITSGLIYSAVLVFLSDKIHSFIFPIGAKSVFQSVGSSQNQREKNASLLKMQSNSHQSLDGEQRILTCSATIFPASSSFRKYQYP